MNKKPSFEDALHIDALLLQMASYETSKGYLLNPTIVNEVEKIQKIQEETIKKFNYFKSLIRKGEATVKELGEMIAEKYGPFKAGLPMSKEQTIDSLEKMQIKEESKDQLADNLLVKMFENILGIGLKNGSEMNFHNKDEKVPFLPEDTRDLDVSKNKDEKESSKTEIPSSEDKEKNKNKPQKRSKKDDGSESNP